MLHPLASCSALVALAGFIWWTVVRMGKSDGTAYTFREAPWRHITYWGVWVAGGVFAWAVAP